MILTHTHLISAGMPSWDIHKFRLLFPDGAEITPENFLQAEAAGLDPNTLYAAVCTTPADMEKWRNAYQAAAYEDFAERSRIEKEMNEFLTSHNKKRKTAALQIQCDLLIKALESQP